MSKHTTPLPHADQTGLEAAEPPQRASRFDERGIALQTVIIMVVLIAIAGSIAAVLFSSAQDATNELENSSVSVNVRTARNDGQCTRSGGSWEGTNAPAAGNAATGEDLGALRAANNDSTMVGWDSDGQATTTAAEVVGYCKPA